jgi:hypothetical protein
MNRVTNKCFLFLCVLFLSSNHFFSQNPRQLIDAVKIKLNKVNNYQADIHIKVRLPYISLLPISTKLYFKQKDKFKIDTKNIAVIPKQGFLILNALVNDSVNYTAMLQSSEVINSVDTRLINLIPNNDTSDVVLAKLWVDAANHVIVKSQVTTKSSGTMLAEYAYASQIAYGLPDAVKFTVDVKKFKIPKAIAADINKSNTKKAEKKSGEILVRLSNYIINKGIQDSFFNTKR